jgi:hypothetical protein
MNVGMADRATVEALAKHLVKAFEEFVNERANENNDVQYVDAFMGCHNFYKTIILDLEERASDKTNMLRRTAIDTLALALGIPR